MSAAQITRNSRHFGWASLRAAWRGLVTAWYEEPSWRIQVIIAMVVLWLAWWYLITFTDRILVLLAVGLVLTAELWNSAIERLCNYINPQAHPLMRTVKDLSAGAVLLAAIIAAIIGVIIFSGYFQGTAFPEY
jgi:diacylglycerol kinase